MLTNMDVSVVICTWNRAELLAQTLERLTAVSVPSNIVWEVIVVNNNCTDSTDDVISLFAERLPLRRVFEATPGLSHARNSALRQARGQWVLFTDDDVLVEREWIGACVEVARRFPEAAVIGGPIDPWFVVPPDPALIEAFPIAGRGFCGLDRGPRERVLNDDEDVYGANMAFKKDRIDGQWFNAALGVTPASLIGGEETDYIRRVRQRGQVVWSPTMRVKHYVEPSRLTLPYVKKFYVNHARMLVKLGSVPAGLATPGPALFGAPRWLWRSTVSAYLRYQVARMLRAGDELVRLRDYCLLLGLLLEQRVMSRSRPS